MANPSLTGALLTDLYELTMLQVYWREGMAQTASFEMFVRRLPAQRGFLLAAGLEEAVRYLQELRFADEELAWLKSEGRFDPAFVDSLRALRFSGDVDAVPEGTVVFADEPLLRVSAPIAQAQLVESRLLNLLHYQTMVATKAARCVQAAAGRELVDFGLRRAHGAEAGLLSARASYLAGFHASATTLAGMRYGIPVSGTMAHSFVQAYGSEAAAFRAFCRVFPGQATLLIDTYDIDAATREVVALSAELRAAGQPPVAAVRIDSGDLAVQARRVRATLDAGGCRQVRIVASGNLDEYAIARLAGQGAPIDVYGVGTRMNTAADAPYLDCAYKLVEYAGQPRRKRSEKKATWPGRKQVWRTCDQAGHIERDSLGLADEALPGRPLLQPVLRGGRLCAPLPSLAQVRATARRELASLPPALCALEPVNPLPPEPSAALRALTEQLDARLAAARH